MVRRLCLLLCLLLLTASGSAAQVIMRQFATGTTLPALPCRQADGFLRIGGSPGVFVCAVGVWVEVGSIVGGGTDWGDIGGTLADQTDLQSALDAKQATLVSATNIKTINGDSVLGSGDLVVTGSGAAWGDITGTLSDQTDLQAELDAKQVAGSYATGTGSANGTNTGDQTSIVGITGTLAEFNTALTGADFATGGGTVTGTSTGTNTGDQTTISGNAGTATALETARNINGTSFNGTANITVTAAADTLTGTTLAALSGANLTALNATQLTSGTVPDARFPATLPAASGVNLTALNAANLGSGTAPTARLGSGTANSTTFLRGDSTWATPSGSGDTVLRLTGNVSTAANQTLVDITGMSFTADAAGIYQIEIFATINNALASTGYGIGINCAETPVLVSLGGRSQLANTGTATSWSAITNNAIVGVTSGIPTNATNVPVVGGGVLQAHATNAGTCIFRLRSEVNAVATIVAQSLFLVRKVN